MINGISSVLQKLLKYFNGTAKKAKNNNLNYLIDPTFTNANRLFVLSFKNEDEDVRTSFRKYYLPSVEIKDFNVLIDGKPFFDIPIKYWYSEKSWYYYSQKCWYYYL